MDVVNKNNEKELISVIVPIYKVEKYIDRCILSLLNQTYSNYEILLVSDVSEDRSVEKCDEFAEKYAKIKHIPGDGLGLAAARKKGVENATGEFITFVDPDDECIITMLETLIGAAEDFDVITSVGVKKRGDRLYPLHNFPKECVDIIGHENIMSDYFRNEHLDGGIWAKLIRRKLFEDVDFWVGAVPGEDICLLLQIFNKVDKIRALSAQTYYYIWVDDGISRGGFTKYHKKGLDAYITTCEDLIGQYPQLKREIAGNIIEYEMAIMTAMCRNDVYDIDTIHKLQKHIRMHLEDVIKNKHTRLYFKASAVMILWNYKAFAFIFKRTRKWFGR